MRKVFPLFILITVLLAGCAGLTNINVVEEPEIPYYVALRTFNGAWESYHKVWIQLPEETKTVWVNKYHKVFADATIFLDAWALDPNNPNPTYDGQTWKFLAEKIETVLIQLAIKKQ